MGSPAVLTVYELRHAFDRWGVKVSALDGISFELRKGEWCMLVGPNGAGKSTLLNILSGVVPWSGAGVVEISGRPLASLSFRERAQLLLHVRQDPMLGSAPELTVGEHLAIADSSVHSALRPLSRQARGRYQSYLAPYGLAGRLNQPVATLSGGERQLLTLLLAGVRGVRLLLLDEAFSGLDKSNAEICLDTLEGMVREGYTVLMVTHDLHLACSRGARIIGLREGKIVLDVAGTTKRDWTAAGLWEVLEQGERLSPRTGPAGPASHFE